jgi:hypothetical protein
LRARNLAPRARPAATRQIGVFHALLCKMGRRYAACLCAAAMARGFPSLWLGMALLVTLALGGSFSLGRVYERKPVTPPQEVATRPDSHRAADVPRAVAPSDQRLNALARRVEALEDERSSAPPSVSEAEQDRRTRQRTADLERSLGKRAATERLDSRWTADVSEGLRERMTEATRLEAVRCGETLCAMSFAHEAADAHAGLFKALMLRGQMAPGFGGQALVRRHPRAEGGYRTTIYLIRPGQKLPWIEPN